MVPFIDRSTTCVPVSSGVPGFFQRRKAFEVATLQEEQLPFDRAVCDAMVASTPDDWNVIILTIERPVGVTVVGRLQHSITNPDNRRSVMPDDLLYEATYRLDELFHRHGAVFRRAVYRVELCQDSWRYTAEFGYDGPAVGRASDAMRDAEPDPGGM